MAFFLILRDNMNISIIHKMNFSNLEFTNIKFSSIHLYLSLSEIIQNLKNDNLLVSIINILLLNILILVVVLIILSG